MKCEYVGFWSHQGCDNDAEPGERFCRVHRIQGPSNELNNKLWACGCIGIIVLSIVLTAVTVCST